jgi:nicotinamidase-related amidase
VNAGFPIAVLVSGSGSNLQAILDRLHGRDGIEVVAVASSKPGVRALERAQSAGVETEVFEASHYPSRAARDRSMADWLKQRGVALVVLAGFMTHMCVNSTARSAFNLGFRPTVVAAATATRDLPAPDGSVVPAAQLQAASLAALCDLFAVVARKQADLPD